MPVTQSRNEKLRPGELPQSAMPVQPTVCTVESAKEEHGDSLCAKVGFFKRIERLL